MKPLTLSFSLCLVLLAPLSAWSEQGYEIMPGLQFIPGPQGGTFGVETQPGVRYYRGEIEGSAIDIAPGVRSYNFPDRTAPLPLGGEPPLTTYPPSRSLRQELDSHRSSILDRRPSWER